jgi:hypothetical protein
LDLALRPSRFPASLEKWYIDALLPDGTVLLVYLASLVLFGWRVAKLSADLFFPDGRRIHGAAPVGAISGAEDQLSFGPASIEGERLRFETKGLSGELRYRARQPAACLRDPFLVHGGRTLSWNVELPDADVEGTLRWPEGELQVAGRGYRDRVWFDLLPWRFPIRELVWGRAHAGPRALTWVHATTLDGAVGGSWVDGAIRDHSGRGPPAPLVLGEPRVLLEADVADLEGIGRGPIGAVIRRAGGDPHEIKYHAPCSLDGQPGMAVHEVVRWRG